MKPNDGWRRRLRRRRLRDGDPPPKVSNGDKRRRNGHGGIGGAVWNLQRKREKSRSARRECLISAMNIWPYGLGRYEHRRCVVAGLATLLGFLPLWRFSPSVRAKAKVGAARRLLTPAHGSWTGLFDAKGPTLGRPLDHRRDQRRMARVLGACSRRQQFHHRAKVPAQ
jgi:hypothetical protein